MTLKDEIRSALSGLSAEENGQVAAHIRFPRDFAGFRGHFPGMPVVPGVCLVQTVVALVEAARKRPFRLQRIANAKFFSVVAPEEDVAVECDVTEAEGGGLKGRALFRVGDRKIADITVNVAPADAKDGANAPA